LDVEAYKQFMINMKQMEKLKLKEKEEPYAWVESFTFPVGVRYLQSYMEYIIIEP